jgi:hypothetical protein
MPRLRVWPGWLAFALALSGQRSTAESIERGEDLSGAWVLIFDLMLLAAAAWLIWRYVKRWRFKRAWRNASA